VSGLFDWLLGDPASGGNFMSRLLEDEPLSAAPTTLRGPLLGDSVMGNAIRGALYGVASDRRSPDFLSGFAAGLRSGAYARVEAQHRQGTNQFDQMQRDKKQREQGRRDQATRLPPPPGVDPEQWEAYKAADPKGALMFFLKSLTQMSAINDAPPAQPAAASPAPVQVSTAAPAAGTPATMDRADDAALRRGVDSIDFDAIDRVRPR
jgi:hypothetical protein